MMEDLVLVNIAKYNEAKKAKHDADMKYLQAKGNLIAALKDKNVVVKDIEYKTL